MQTRGSTLALFFVGAAALVAVVLNVAVADILLWVKVANTPVLGDSFKLSALIAVLASAVIAFYCGVMNQTSRQFVDECLSELDKVAWPSWDETKTSTFVVVATSFVGAVILGLFDTVFSYLSSHNLFLQ